jgi:hypothetical protein
MTVASGTASRPIAASANNAYVAVAVGSARPAMMTGSRRRRAASRGEYELVWIWAATKTPENVMPANAIIPAASAPKISCAALTLTGSRPPSSKCRSSTGRKSASAIAARFAASTGTHIADASQIRARNRRVEALTGWPVAGARGRGPVIPAIPPATPARAPARRRSEERRGRR